MPRLGRSTAARREPSERTCSDAGSGHKLRSQNIIGHMRMLYTGAYIFTLFSSKRVDG